MSKVQIRSARLLAKRPIRYHFETIPSMRHHSRTAGFYALAYDIGAGGPEGLAGTTVISYRGTDTSLDHSTGWSVGAGNIDDWTRRSLALEFYTAVSGQSYRDGPASDVILTGHSLGGGLAA